MALVTVTDYVEVDTPSMEVVVITPAADGDTYVSRKFSRVRAAILVPYGWSATTADAYSIASISGGTVTLQLVNTTTSAMTLVLWGD